MRSTATDPDGSHEWIIDDQPTQLHRWGTDTNYPLPSPPGVWMIGAADGCWLQIQDDEGRVSRQHARVTYDDGEWTATDLHSKNGIYQDGARRGTVVLAPGVELGIGGITLVTESPLLQGLRDVLARLIGWSDERREAVDLALRAVRLAATRRGSLQLCGAGDLVSIAQLLHRRTLGEGRPFIVCDPRRIRADPSARSATNYANGMEALAAAAGGTLCIWQSRQPDDFAEVVKARSKPTSRVQLVVCTHTVQLSDQLIGSPVVLPALAEREAELDRIIDAYAVDAGATSGETLTPFDREWIYRHEASTLSRIEKATRRLVAVRKAGGSITRAAAQVGMAHGALSEWIARRTLDIDDDDSDS